MQSAIRTEALSLKIGGARILDEVSLTVHDGEFLVIIGPNGAGKSTLLNLLSGVTPASAGTVSLFGRTITDAPPYVRARLGLGRTFQTSSIFPGLTTLENVRLAAQAFLGGSAAIWRRADAAKTALARGSEVLEKVGLGSRARALAASLSHGEKRKLDLAILLCGKPRVALLDEPTAGMAAESVPEMIDLIRRIHKDERTTIVMVEHRLDLVMALADRMAVMHHGALIAVDTPARIVENETVQSAYLGDPL